MSDISRYFLKKYYKALNNFQDKNKLSQWMIMYKWENQLRLSDADFYQNMKYIIPPSDRFYADPFPYFYNNEYYIFIEELVFSEDVGFISVIKLDDNGNYQQPVPIIKTNYHMSYPLIFKIGQDIFIMPTNHQEKKIEIWKAIEFPYRWHKEYEIMQNVEAADSTPFYYDNRWWMFTSIRSHKKQKLGDELFLFSSDDIFSANWQAHPLNPVVKGIVDTRCAGNVFMYENKLIRPCQDSLKRYGWAIDFKSVDLLTAENYQESTYFRLEPCWQNEIKGTHTFNYDNGLLVMDGFRVV